MNQQDQFAKHQIKRGPTGHRVGQSHPRATLTDEQVAANYLERFREKSSEAPVSLIRKRCACGAVVTAKQLTQYGCCNKCVRSA